MRQLSEALDHFHEHGWARLPQAIPRGAVAAIVEAVWNELSRVGIVRNDRTTWTQERPTDLQRLKKHPALDAVGSSAVRAFVDAALDGAAWADPPNWGASFIAFPTAGEWNLPTTGWHLDARHSGSLRPARGIKTLALLADIAPRAGATVMASGSHRLIHRWFRDHPLPRGTTNAEARKHLRAHPFIAALHQPAPPADRIARLMDAPQTDGDIALQVVEATGAAGDVIVMHPLTLHAASPNCGAAPRLMISGGVTTDMWGWGAS